MLKIHSRATLATTRVIALFCMLLKALKLGLEFRFPSSCLLILAFIIALTCTGSVLTVLSTILSILSPATLLPLSKGALLPLFPLLPLRAASTGVLVREELARPFLCAS